MRVAGIAVLATILSATGVLAQDSGPLSAGAPAGVRTAARQPANSFLYYGTGAALMTGVGILMSGQSAVTATVLAINGGGIGPITPTTVTTTTTGTH